MFNQSYGVHITPLVINSIEGGDTDTDTHTDVHTEAILRNQASAGHSLACAWFKKRPSRSTQTLHYTTLYTHTHTHARTHTYTHTHIYTHTHTHTYTHIHTHTHTSVLEIAAGYWPFSD